MKASFPKAVLWLVVLGAALAGRSAWCAEVNPRERLLMDFGWKFHLGDDWGPADNLAKAASSIGPAALSYSVASWRSVQLPHDWAVELPFDPKADVSHGFKALGDGFPQNNIGWYRRSFDLPAADAGKRIWLEFDGVFRDCTVFVNGWVVGRHASGYSGFRYDITDVVNCGAENIVAVRVDASRAEGWFYEGAGIYRHVWLVKTSPLAVAPDGVFAFAQFPGNIPGGTAVIHLEAALQNSTAVPAAATLRWEITSPDGTVVASASRRAKAGPFSLTDVRQTARIASPQLWSPESPKLYTVATTVTNDGRLIDRIETEFGIRTIGFDPEKGFMLNGRPYEIKGTCNHQDHAGVGSALPDGLQYFRIARLKEFGGNAYRTSHNPPTPELLEACDRLGMLVMDENRLLGSDADNLDRLEQQVRRDRNHASVVIWSIANEEFAAEETPAGGRVAVTMQALVKRLDPTRPVTAAVDRSSYAGIDPIIEVRGWNYHIGAAMDEFHRSHPEKPNVGTEQGSTVGTRGIYADDKGRGYVSAYDDYAPEWANTAEAWWSFFDPRPWLSGGFVWTGFDYRGEPTPCAWPCISSHFGVLDTCGFPKDNFWYYKSWWTAEPVLHLMPHWNWAGREGQPIDVRALSNCDEVELFLNGRSLGRQTMKKDFSLRWQVPYEAGRLSARGYRNGNLAAETAVETAGPPARLSLEPDRSAIAANREDVAVITVGAYDAQGRPMPTASDAVAFTIEGPGKILGVGNGDPSCHEPDAVIGKSSTASLPIGGWKMKKYPTAGAEIPHATEASYDDSSWDNADVLSESGPLLTRESGVFRVHFSARAEDLAAPGVELWFGKIEGGGVVYVNGHNVGASNDPRYASVYDVKRLLHEGDNSIAVTISNWGAIAGINRGVKLRLTGAPAAVHWRRSLFNGLAQIIVQSTGEPGDIRLKAEAPGLKPAEITIAANPAPFRPALP